MKEDEQRDIEKYLRSFTLRPAPRGLRSRILTAAAKEKASPALTPFFRKCFAGCAAALIVIFAADALVSRLESRRIEALWGKRPPVEVEKDGEVSALAEIIGVPSAYLQIAKKKTPPTGPAAIQKAIAAHLFDANKMTLSEEEF